MLLHEQLHHRQQLCAESASVLEAFVVVTVQKCHGAVRWNFLNLLSKPGPTQPLQHHIIQWQGLTSGATGLSPPGPTPPRAEPPLVLTVMFLSDTPGVPRSPRLGRTMGSVVIGSEWSRALMSAASCQTSSLAWVMDSCRQTGDSAVAVCAGTGRPQLVWAVMFGRLEVGRSDGGSCPVSGHLPHLHAGAHVCQAAAGKYGPAAWQSHVLLVPQSWAAKASRGPTA